MSFTDESFWGLAWPQTTHMNILLKFDLLSHFLVDSFSWPVQDDIDVSQEVEGGDPSSLFSPGKASSGAQYPLLDSLCCQPCKLNHDFILSPVTAKPNQNMGVNTCASPIFSKKLSFIRLPLNTSSGEGEEAGAISFPPLSYFSGPLLFLGEKGAKDENDILMISKGWSHS